MTDKALLFVCRLHILSPGVPADRGAMQFTVNKGLADPLRSQISPSPVLPHSCSAASVQAI
jgi:hypothetical protein